MLRIAFAILALATPAQPWGPAGHHIVAIIAEQRLSPQVREKINKLLMDGKYSIVDISTCADALRGDARPGQTRPGEEMCRPLAVTSAASKAGLVSPSGLVNGSVRRSNFAPSRLIRISSTSGKTRERRSTMRPDFWTNRCSAASSAWARSSLGEGKSLRPRFSMDSENSERCVDFARHDKEEKTS